MTESQKVNVTQVLHNLPKEVIDTIKKLGVIVGDMDLDGRIVSYYNLPQWFKEVDGKLFEVDYADLPEMAQRIENIFKGTERVFSLREMKACALEMANWGSGYSTALPPKEYFKTVLNVDID